VWTSTTKRKTIYNKAARRRQLNLKSPETQYFWVVYTIASFYFVLAVQSSIHCSFGACLFCACALAANEKGEGYVFKPSFTLIREAQRPYPGPGFDKHEHYADHAIFWDCDVVSKLQMISVPPLLSRLTEEHKGQDDMGCWSTWVKLITSRYCGSHAHWTWEQGDVGSETVPRPQSSTSILHVALTSYSHFASYVSRSILWPLGVNICSFVHQCNTFTSYFLLIVDMFRPHTAIFRCYSILSISWCSVMPIFAYVMLPAMC
jgi:hypothetical protein